MQGRRAADNLTGQPRQQVLALCDEVDGLSRQLADLVRRGQGNTPQAQALAKSVPHVTVPPQTLESSASTFWYYVYRNRAFMMT